MNRQIQDDALYNDEEEEKKADFWVGFAGGFWLFIGMFIGAIVTIITYIYIMPYPEHLPPTKENCIQLFNSLN